ncbi:MULTISPECIES: hypothetical protein [unclassified Streptomyces]|uniref:hypothetical protein n=1 Tax=unclassified Streptomyces TaxID=2593676 RepID=UPI0008DE9D66|nr:MULTISPECIES: hypothetical protein [unclassified Streptomyces]OII66971.1 hypothetical protein BJP39_07575 [Streptomyces sp. CC77]
MRGDETQPAAADGGAGRTRRGPRHAAPRKSLLTKLQQGPAGKALALAAMPTAVLVGMSLTPPPALADENDIPFAPGPCVTQPDEPQEPEATPSATASASPKPSSGPSQDAQPKPSASPSASRTGSGGDDGSGTGSGTDEGAGTGTGSGTGAKPGTAGPTTQPAPATSAPAPAETRNPLDPLGVGEAIGDLLGGLTDAAGALAEPRTEEGPQAGDAAQQSSAAPAADTKPADAEAADTKPADDAAVERGSGDAKAPAAPKPSTEPADTPADPVERAIKDAADQAGAEVRELPDDVKGLDPKQDEEIPDGAKPRFPCPTPDPQALADADLEPGLPHLPDDPWRLESTLLTLRGLKYHGIVEVKTGSGTVKKALKFTASEVDIKDLHQITVHSEGRKAHVESRPGSTSTLRNGTVTMYTEELKGNLFGIIPITFSPDSPPPLDVPFAFFTQARVVQAGQFGGTLTVPGLHNHIEG